MKKIKRICAVSLMILSVLISALPSAGADNTTDISAALVNTAKYLQATVSSPSITQTGGDWTVIGLARSGAGTGDYFQTYYDNAVNYLEACGGILSNVKYSEYSRVALAMTAIGADPENVGGYNMLSPLRDYDKTISQGINGPVFALLALSAAGYGGDSVCDKYISYILSKQLKDGGFALSGSVSDPDTTSMAITALSSYKSKTGVNAAIDKAVTRLSALQRESGGFSSYSLVNSESVSQAVIALCSLGISVDDERFVKNGNSLIDNLMTYKKAGGGFEHEIGGGVNIMATEQAFCALTAVSRQRGGKSGLYDMSDVSKTLLEESSGGLPGKHKDIIVPDSTNPGAKFSDTAGHQNVDAIFALARRGIINGYNGGIFAPDNTITRAEFAAILIRALGLKSSGNTANPYNDVPDGVWYTDYVLAASQYGLIQGKGGGSFDPNGLITRQEAAVMTVRAAKLCGMELELDDTAERNILSQFTDYKTLPQWSSHDLAFCYYYDILDKSDIEIRAEKPILRGEIAEMLYRMLVKARLV